MGPGPVPPPATWTARRRVLSSDWRGIRGSRVRALSATRILVGESEIDLSASGALVHPSQGRTLATILSGWLGRGMESFHVPQLAQEAALRLEVDGPGAFAGHPRGDLAEVRAQEIMMLLNRLRNLVPEEPRP